MLTNNKLVLASFIAFAMLAMAATTIVTQEAYAKHTHYHYGAYCGTNWQGTFHLSVGNAALSIPAGMCIPDNTETLGPSS
ncbi:MAG: hypothetical protein WAM14_08955 [Candidatus Nitrosopolaris sp.]